MSRKSDAPRLMAAIQALVRRFSVAERADIACCGMTVAQAATLEALAGDSPLPLSILRSRLGIAPSTMTRNLERLRDRRLVQTTPDPADGRAVRVSLTAEGRRAAARVAAQEMAFAESILAALGESSSQQTVAALENLLGAVRAVSDSCCPGAFDHLIEPAITAGGNAMLDPTFKGSADLTSDPEQTVQAVKERYGAIARSGGSCCSPQASCCGPAPVRAAALAIGYSPLDLELLPEGANLGLGCGAPIAHLELAPGETVLDLGSGAGVDAILAGRAVGPTGRVIGVDMTDEMLERARANAAAVQLEHVEFRRGRLESLPVDDASVDAVTSNCVINLVPDKEAVFREIHRVLRPGGRLVVSDVMLDGSLPEVIRDDVMAYVGCVAGAVERERYLGMLQAAGLGEVEILRDIDFLATTGDDPIKTIADVLERAGLTPADVQGVVRSVTYRARKRLESS